MELPWTMSGAADWAAQGKLEAWIHEFLTGEGNNQPFSDGLKLFPRHYFGPVILSLGLLPRCTGPEEGMKYSEPRESFETRVTNIVRAIENGFDLPPLIVGYSGEVFEINDGNHRHEALLRSGRTSFGVVVWTTEASDMDAFKARTASPAAPAGGSLGR